jgi:hypothetical protein
MKAKTVALAEGWLKGAKVRWRVTLTPWPGYAKRVLFALLKSAWIAGYKEGKAR